MEYSLSLLSLSHHSHYLVGSDDLRSELKAILEKEHDIIAQGNPDFFELVHETFTIDDSRNLRELHSVRPVDISGKKIFIVSISSITTEAQNALLKLLEEPAEYAYFFFIISSAHLLLPTIKSRLVFIETSSPKKKETSSVEGDRFLKSSSAKRLDIIKKLLEDISKEKKTKQQAVEFIDEIEFALYSKGKIKDNIKSFETLDLARKYSTDRAPSLKILLEYVALNS